MSKTKKATTTFATPNPKRRKSEVKLIPPSPFMTRLGCGTGVNVYLMDRSPAPSGVARSPWAIKKINRRLDTDAFPEYEERIKKEADLLKTIEHPNIIGYRGASRSKNGDFCLCMEKSEQSLYDIIQSREEKKLGSFAASEIEQVALGISKALLYLHETKSVLHGDLKSANVLVKGNDYSTVKLCDFGVSVGLPKNGGDDDEDLEDYVGTGPWTPREVMDGEPPTDKADIYAFGCLLYEMLTLCVPHMGDMDDMGDDSLCEDSFDVEAYEAKLGTTPSLNPADYDGSYTRVLELFWCCAAEDPDKRPTAGQVAEALKGVDVSSGASESPVVGEEVNKENAEPKKEAEAKSQ